jgi:IS1 family transposase
MANVLPADKKLRVLAALVEGNSIRAIERMTGVHRDTIMRFGVAMGEAAARVHDRMMRGLACPLIQMDEIWSYVGKKQARVTAKDGAGVGEAYVFTAMDASSRMVISFHVGKRDQESTDVFMADLRARLVVMPAIVSDGFAPYVNAVGQSFGPGVDYSQMSKNYRSGGRREDHRYEPPRDPFITKKAVFGVPDMAKTSTAYMERNNATMRHHIGRMRRLCYAFSKRIENHRAAIALTYVWYNVGLVVSTLRMTPAMASGVEDHIWSLDEFLAALLAAEPCEKPIAQPLEPRVPEGTARQLPEGRGWLRVVPGGAANAMPPHEPTPVAPAVAVEAIEVATG